jgi:hypothetical protein
MSYLNKSCYKMLKISEVKEILVDDSVLKKLKLSQKDSMEILDYLSQEKLIELQFNRITIQPCIQATTLGKSYIYEHKRQTKYRVFGIVLGVLTLTSAIISIIVGLTHK